MKKAERGTVIVLTLAGLTAILGVIGLAIDLGLWFDYQQRAQSAADAGALAAALNPAESEYRNAAREMAEENGFKDGDGYISVTPETPPLEGDYAGVENYFEVTIINDKFPTTFLQMIGIKDLPIRVRAVAEGGGGGSGSGGGGGYCLTVGDTKIENNGKLTGMNCKFYFGDKFENKGTISADTINKKDGKIGSTKVDTSMLQPPAPGNFPDPSKFGCTRESSCDDEKTLSAGCYAKIEVKGRCSFGAGAYFIDKELKFENNAKATGSCMTFFLNTGSKLDFTGKATLTSGAPGFGDVIVWSKGSEIIFGNNSKPELTGQIYAPGVPVTFGGTYDLIPTTPSSCGGGLVE